MIQSDDGFQASNYASIDLLHRSSNNELLCNICGTLKDSFLPGGVQAKRPNAKCPTCGSLERHRLQWLYLANHVWATRATGKMDVLHVAPEPFFVERLKARPDVNYVSGDFLVPDAMCKLDLTDMCFWDGQFDVVICSHVLEHIPDDAAAMREMRRVLRSSGILVVMVPVYGDTTYEDPRITAPEDRLRHFGQADHVRKYGLDILGRLEDAGFNAAAWPRAGEPGEHVLRFIASRGRTLFACRPR